MNTEPIKVGKSGFVRYVDHMGTDRDICDAARISYGKTSEDNYSREKQETLINYLMRSGHTTPFEMCEVKLHIRVPMDTWRQWIRHRTANVNEYSTRYKPAINITSTTDPTDWRLQATDNKQGSDGYLTDWPVGTRKVLQAAGGIDSYLIMVLKDGTKIGPIFVANENINNDVPSPGNFLTILENQNHMSSSVLYQQRIALGVALEQARKDLPLSTYTEAYWKCDLHNIFNFLRLRMDSHAQKEIREYAHIIGYEIIAKLYPLAWEAFLNYKFSAMTLSAIDIMCIQFSQFSVSLTKREKLELIDKCFALGIDTTGWSEAK